MKSTTKSKVINLRRFGDLMDDDGDKFFDSALIQVFLYLEKRKLLIHPEQQCSVLVSKIDYEFMRRYSARKTVSIADLLEEWQKTFREDYSLESLVSQKQKEEAIEEAKFETFEKQAQQRSAWGMYSATVRQNNYDAQEREFRESIRQLSSDEQERLIKERGRNKRSNYLFIG